MASLAEPQRGGFHQEFHRRWSHLRDPHVRTLAWLLDSPDMLDAAAPQWQGRIASLGPDAGLNESAWLAATDRDPQALHDMLNVHRFTRLGRYAEQLLAYYFSHAGLLVQQGLQVRQGGHTIGEFDFLLRRPQGLAHWELATKLYLLQGLAQDQRLQADYFVGPNLADTLGAKLGKVIHRQLALSSHAAAQAVLPEPVTEVAALIKGWLFYPAPYELPLQGLGLSAGHCRGFWSELDRFQPLPGQRVRRLTRLEWLAPLAVPEAETEHWEQARAVLQAGFAEQSMPVMLAVLEEGQGQWREVERGFIVPADWATRAGRRAATLSLLS